MPDCAGLAEISYLHPTMGDTRQWGTLVQNVRRAWRYFFPLQLILVANEREKDDPQAERGKGMCWMIF